MAFNGKERLSNFDLAIRLLISVLILAALVLILYTRPALANIIFPGSHDAGYHLVRSGESLRSIAVEHETTVEKLAAANKLTFPYALSVGQRLLIPPAGQIAPQSPAEVIERFYKWYSAEKQAGNHPLESGLWKSAPYLTAALKTSIDEKLANSAASSDPFLCGQQPSQGVIVEHMTASAMQVRASVRLGSSGDALTVAVEREADGWKISGIACPVD